MHETKVFYPYYLMYTYIYIIPKIIRSELMVINNQMKNDEVEELSSAMVQQSKQLDQSELFITNIAQKFQLLFPWQNSRHIVTENLWKIERISQACKIYPELSIQEVEKLVERDWRMMAQQERKNIQDLTYDVSFIQTECNYLEAEIQLCLNKAANTVQLEQN